MSIEIQKDIQRAAECIRQARFCIVFTGAGMSTASGIPDFRSANTGLWQRDNPMEVSSLTTFRRQPERFFNWLRPLAEKMWQAQPNPAHMALAQMEQEGFVRGVITQNIDGLHQRAGSKAVVEVHGTLETLSCLKCRQRFPTAQFADEYIQRQVLPRCTACQSILKPDIVLFEEALPPSAWDQAVRWCQRADVIVVMGSSLEVVPAALLPQMAVERGARLILVNFTPTHLDEQAEVIFNEDLVKVIPALWQALQG